MHSSSRSKLVAAFISANIAIVLLATLSIARAQASGQLADDSASSVVDANGKLRVPKDYRSQYEYLGSWPVAAKKSAGAKELHNVFASPGTIAAYRETGKFPDGTVLVKEVYGTSTGLMTTGTVSYAASLKGWFVMVRENTDKHPGNHLWGNGWGWSWFNADNPSISPTTNFRISCLGCHLPAASTNWIYVKGYPPLQAAH